MASRRRLGAAIQQIGSSIAPLMQAYLQEQRDTRQNQAILERQAANERLQSEGDLLKEVLKDPALALRVKSAGIGSLAGVGTDRLQPTEQQIASPLLGEIAGAKQLGDLTDPTTLMQRFRTSGGSLVPKTIGQGDQGLPPEISALLAARDARQGALEKQIPAVGVDAYNPTLGAKERQYVRQDQLAGRTFQTDPTAAQAGANDLAKAQAGELNPQMTALKVGQANALESGTRGEKVRTAGAVAGAEAGARTSAEINAKYKALPMLKQIESEIAQARLTGKPSTGIAEAATKQMAGRMVQLATILNTTDNRMVARSGWMRGKVGDWTGIGADTSPAVDPQTKQPLLDARGKPMTRADVFHELETLNQGMTSVFLRKLGRVGTPTENDEKRTRGILPAGGLTTTENTTTNENFLKIIDMAESIGQQLGAIDPNLPLAAQEAETARRLDMITGGAAQVTGAQSPTGATYVVGPDGKIQRKQ